MGVTFFPLLPSGFQKTGGGGSGAVDSVNGQTGTVQLELYDIERYTLTPTDISNKFVTLSFTPSDDAKVRLIPLSGIEQDNGVDFSVTGTQVSWSSLGFETLAESGDKIIIVYTHV